MWCRDVSGELGIVFECRSGKKHFCVNDHTTVSGFADLMLAKETKNGVVHSTTCWASAPLLRFRSWESLVNTDMSIGLNLNEV